MNGSPQHGRGARPSGPGRAPAASRRRAAAFTLVELPFGKLRAVSQRESAAFTLVELLVVIMIIGILLGTLLPTLSKVRLQMLVHHSQATINRIHGACQEYYADHGIYPQGLGATTQTKGLVRALTVSFRKVTRGSVYGPYNSADTLTNHKAMKGGDTDEGSGPEMFHDAFSNPILYYLYRKSTGDYNAGSIDSGIAGGVPGNLNTYLRGPGGVFFRADFVLLSAGPNGTWEVPYSLSAKAYTTSDDLNNFFND